MREIDVVVTEWEREGDEDGRTLMSSWSGVDEMRLVVVLSFKASTGSLGTLFRA